MMTGYLQKVSLHLSYYLDDDCFFSDDETEDDESHSPVVCSMLSEELSQVPTAPSASTHDDSGPCNIQSHTDSQGKYS